MSKIYITAGDCRNLLSKVKDTVGTGRLSPYDSFILMTVTDFDAATAQGTLSLTTTNETDSSTFKYHIDADDNVEFPIVKFKQLYDVISTFDVAAQLEIEAVNEDMMITYPGSKKPLKIAGVDRAKFAPISFVKNPDKFVLPMEIVAQTVEALSPYTADVESSAVLGCINCVFTANDVTFESFDQKSNTMAYARHQGYFGYQGSFFISFAHIKKAVKKYDDKQDVTIEVSDNCVQLSQGDYSNIFRRFAGTFPNCSTLFPEQYVSTLRINADNGNNVFTRAAIMMANGRRALFQLDFSANGFGIDLETEMGSISEQINGTVSGFTDFRAFCNLDQLVKITKQATGNDIEIYSPQVSMIIFKPDGYNFDFKIAMPCKFEVDQAVIDGSANNDADSPTVEAVEEQEAS